MDYIKVDIEWLEYEVEKCRNKIKKDLDKIDDLFFDRLRTLIDEKNKVPFWNVIRKLLYSDVPSVYPSTKFELKKACSDKFRFSWSFRNLGLYDMSDELKKIEKLIKVAKSQPSYLTEVKLSSNSASLLKDIMNLDIESRFEYLLE